MTYHARPIGNTPPAAPHAMPGLHGKLVGVGLGDVPRGFYETTEDCDQTSAAFLRGVLYDKAAYYAMSAQQKMALEKPPRWVLYAGPFSMRSDALAFESNVWLWATRNGYIWLSLGAPCIVGKHRLPWPPDASWQWTWVFEDRLPRRVVRKWNPALNQYSYYWAE